MTFNENMTVILNTMNENGKTDRSLLYRSVGKKIQMSGCHTMGQDICILLFGNVYNWRYFSLDETSEDVIRRMYINFGMEYTLQKLEGVFSIILLDQRIEFEQSKLYVSIDHIGLIPMYIITQSLPEIIKRGTSSLNFTNTIIPSHQYDNSMIIISNKKSGTSSVISRLDPGTFYTFTLSHKVNSKWERSIQNTTYSVIGNNYIQSLKEIIRQETRSLPSHQSPLSISNVSNKLFSNKLLLKEIIKKYIGFSKNINCIIDPNIEESYFIADVIEQCFGGDDSISIETYTIVCDGDTINTDQITRYNHTNINICGIVTDKTKIKYLASSIRDKNNDVEDIIVFHWEGIQFLKEYDNDELQINFSLREKVKNIHNRLIPNIIEPFYAENLNVVFPLLDKSWIDYYLSIPHF